ncbi:MAG TPA: PD-(D/E)XK nuclease family protein [Acidimicrobiales bacterium]|nr:PD-(D/E)XK nuclease family protein [Acidimicrobiales bacterium]
MGCELRWTPHGEPALEALAEVVAAARSADALAPVTVITPTPAVAVATRRALAQRLGGALGIGFAAVGDVAELLAAPRLAAEVGTPATAEVVVAAVRVALDAEPGVFGPISGHRRTWERVAQALVELDGVDAGALARLASAGAVPAELVRVLADVRTRLGHLGSGAALRLATDLARAGGATVTALGTVVVHLPAAPRPAELALLAALAGHVPVVVLAGATGDPALDAALASQLAALGSPGPPPALPPAVPTEIVSANDVDDEVRAAVRRLLALADAGTPLSRLALVHPSGPPYARIVADVLADTGLPVAGPSVHRLSQTAAGRVLLGLLEVERSRFGRQEVVDLWATGVVVDGEGRPVPSARFDERSRRLGVVREAARWHDGLTADDARTDDPERRAENARLRGALEDLEALCASRPTTWSEVATWAGQVLDQLCGPARRRSWPDAELAADEAVRSALGRLAALEDVEADPGPDVVRDTIRTALDAPAPRAGRTGSGLLVTTLDAPPLVPLDAVAVVGLAEGHVPRIGGDDGLLGDELRRAVGLPAADDHQRTQRRALLAALASASGSRIVTHARHDQRSGRALVPSRWLAELVEQRTGRRPETEELLAGTAVDGVTLVASHGAGLAEVAAGRLAPLDLHEHALAALVADGTLDHHPAAADPVLAAGAELVRARRSPHFTRFDGNLDGDGVDVTALGVLSPTSLETYARCPRRWFFSQALGLRPLDRPEEIPRIQPRDRGSLAHAALERFYEEAIAAGSVPAPGERWSDEQRGRLGEIVEACCADAEARGITGHPRWWEHDRAEIHRVLQRVLDGDDEQRVVFGTVPVAVELTFGRDGAPPLAVDLGDGRTVLLAGQADRVDAGGGRVVVWDYKYSGPGGFAALATDEADGGDPLGGGTKVQLVAYAMAAAEAEGLPAEAEVHAWYWFLAPPHTNSLVGYAVGPDLRDRFRRVLRVLADGIAAGHFPARPGEHQYHRGNFEHCAWCEFDPICPRDRDDEWRGAREHPDLASLVALLEDGSGTLVGAGGDR